MTCYALESEWLSRRVSGKTVFGKTFLQAVAALEGSAADWLTRLGNYVLITVARS